ncbi:MAG: metal ABC transporter substrate-binding protein [Desulfovibrio sp.]|jgi:zinc transport system substrate-binding protein|nr:metal ABC transporter substrate-binding protein [Desulfovibrio sp.]
MLRRLLLPLALFLLCAMPGQAPAQARLLKIVTGTSLIEDIVRDLTDGRVETVTLIAGSSCPGHDNANPADFVFAARADAILVHAFQKNMPQFVGMAESVSPGEKRIDVMETRGSWLVPANQRKALDEVAEVLMRLSPDDAPAVRKRAELRLARINQAESESLPELAAFKNTPVIAADMQSEFVRWAGFDVLETYRRSEEMTARDVAKLTDALRGRKIAGVIDNFQSGADAGLPLALELKAPHVVLSNFPGFTDNVPDYFSLLRYNITQLVKLGR